MPLVFLSVVVMRRCVDVFHIANLKNGSPRNLRYCQSVYLGFSCIFVRNFLYCCNYIFRFSLLAIIYFFF